MSNNCYVTLKTSGNILKVSQTPLGTSFNFSGTKVTSKLLICYSKEKKLTNFEMLETGI